MGTDLFSDIEQDNNPSFYGDALILANPYNPSHSASTPADGTATIRESSPDTNDLVNSTLGISNRIADFLKLPDLEILVVLLEHLVNTLVVVYLIQLGFSGDNDDARIVVKRRYLEFKLFREQLIRLYPTVIVPPIPEKHTLMNYLVNSINQSHELGIIDLRKRYFTRFLNELLFNLDPRLRQLALTVKFLDPNYEMAWDNALREPPVLALPSLLLLANPVDTTDQNGLYVLLPLINGFDLNLSLDNLSLLTKINDDLQKLYVQKQLMDSKLKDFEQRLKVCLESEHDDQFFHEIPVELVAFEREFHLQIKVLSELDKINTRKVKDYKSLIHNLIELGGNLNNFSLQVYDQTRGVDNSLSAAIEKFGLAIDLNFLNFEEFVQESLIPEWQEPVHQIIQYFYLALTLIKFYKYKVIQYKLLYKHKFQKYQEVFGVVVVPEIAQGKTADLDHLQGLPSASLSQAIQKIKSAKENGGRELRGKKSWYGIFGGGSNHNKQFSKKLQAESGESAPDGDIPGKLKQVERELTKLGQLIDLTTRDMNNLTSELINTYHAFLRQLECKWIWLMVAYLRQGRATFEENKKNFIEFKTLLTQDT